MSANTSNETLACWNCGTDLSAVPLPVSRHEQCPGCFESLHCCRLCRHYRPEHPTGCDEERADPPVVKENANFCEWFTPAAGAFNDSRTGQRDAAESRLAALFGNSEENEESEADEGNEGDNEPTDRQPPDDGPLPSKDAAARTRLDDLFNKD